MNSFKKMHIAVLGSGAAGLSAAWLLSKRHKVTLLEKESRLGGHANTVTTGDPQAPQIDTGFIVYNEPSYPNLTRWFANMNVSTEASDMSFAVSRDNGSFEYAGGPPLGLLAQPSLLLRPRFYRMLRELMRFYREAPKHLSDYTGTNTDLTLGEFLQQGGYSKDFLDDHLMPFAAAIWSAPPDTLLAYPATSFIRFCENHGLLQVKGRPQWRTVSGGSHMYVNEVEKAIGHENIKSDFAASRIERDEHGVTIHSHSGHSVSADHVVVATHADQALALLHNPDEKEQQYLGAFDYEANTAILHTDKNFMPSRRRAWCSWNYVEAKATEDKVCVSYWMNRLQNLDSVNDYFVTLNPSEQPDPDRVVTQSDYEHPIFDSAAIQAQKRLWRLQGQRRTWFCGSYFGAGFHEDAVQSGFAVAEQLGELSRPWQLDNPSNRIVVTRPQANTAEVLAV